MIDPEKKALVEALGEQLSKSKAELVTDIEKGLGDIRRMLMATINDQLTEIYTVIDDYLKAHPNLTQ